MRGKRVKRWRETDQTDVERSIAAMCKHSPRAIRLDTRQVSGASWRLSWFHQLGASDLIVATSDFDRFCKIVSEVLELRRGLARKPAARESDSIARRSKRA